MSCLTRIQSQHQKQHSPQNNCWPINHTFIQYLCILSALNYRLLPMKNVPSLPLSIYVYKQKYVHPVQAHQIMMCLHLAAISYFITYVIGYASNSLYPPLQRSWKGGILVSPCPSVRLWTESCPLCIFNNTHRIHFIFTHLIKQL